MHSDVAAGPTRRARPATAATWHAGRRAGRPVTLFPVRAGSGGGAAASVRSSRAGGRSCRGPGASRRASPRSGRPWRTRGGGRPSPSRWRPACPGGRRSPRSSGSSSSDPPASQAEQSASTTWRWNGDSGRVIAGGPVWSAVVTSGSTSESGRREDDALGAEPDPVAVTERHLRPRLDPRAVENVPLKLPRSSRNQRSPSAVTTAWCRLTVGFSMVEIVVVGAADRELGARAPARSRRRGSAGSRDHGRNFYHGGIRPPGRSGPTGRAAAPRSASGDGLTRTSRAIRGREPPVVATEDRHRRRDHHRPHERRVEEDRDREAAAELLEADDAPGHEAARTRRP